MGGSSKKVTVGYKYYLGMHIILCHGPIDYIKRIRVDDRDAWTGFAADERISINAPGLFGGENREGGISGSVDIEMGGSTQLQNDYLQARLGNDIPAFRGVVGAVLRQVYLGLNPYLKKWAFRAQRIHTRGQGATQWYDEKSAILSVATADSVFVENFNGGKAGYLVYDYPTSGRPEDGLDDFDIVNDTYGPALLIEGGTFSVTSHPSIYKVLAVSAPLQRVTIKFKVLDRQDNDNGLMTLRDSSFNSVFGIGFARDKGIDSLQRPNVAFTDKSGQYGNPIGSGPVPLDVWHEAYIDYNSASGEFKCSIYNLETDQLFGSVTIAVGPRPDIYSVHFENDRSTVTAGSSLVDDVIITVGDVQQDMNPAHIIRECLTDSVWGMGYLEADIDDTSFSSAADTLYDEGMGISLLWDRQIPIEDFVSEIVRHINATLYVDRVTGLFTLKLIRNDYDEVSLISLDETNISNVSDYSRIDPGESVNSVTVVYWDAVTGENGSVTADDIGMIQAYGSVVNTTVQYPGFTNSTLASKVAARDLQTLSSPLLSCKIEANREAASLNIGDVFKFYWPDYHDGYIVMRVHQIALGDGKKNRVKITATEDVFALPTESLIAEEGSGWEEVGGAPEAVSEQLVFEAPYYELVQFLGQTTVDSQITDNPEIGYLYVAAARPNNGINAQLWVDSGAGYTEGGVLDFCPTATLGANVSRTETSWTFTNEDSLENVTIGSHAQINGELFKVEALDIDLGTMTVGRAVLDTIPEEHTAGDKILFWDAYPASDETEYVSGETLDVKILTNSSQGTLALAAAPVGSITLDQRALRPYRPANLKADIYLDPPDSWYPTYPVDVTWVERNRLQETSGDLLTWTDATITPEVGTDYRVKVEAVDDVGAVVGTIEEVLTSGSTTYQLTEATVGTWAEYPFMRVTVTTVVNGLDSFKSPYVQFRGPFREPNGLQVIYREMTAPTSLQGAPIL